MRIDKIEFLEPYKCINKGTVMDFSGTGNYCALVGLNGSGKSSIIDYLLSIFSKKDFPVKNYISSDNGKLPKFVIHIYNGESKFGSRLSYNDKDDIYFLQLDSSVWCLASLILQIKKDPLIDYFKLECVDVEVLQKKIIKEIETDTLNKEYNEATYTKRKQQRKYKSGNKEDYSGINLNEYSHKQGHKYTTIDKYQLKDKEDDRETIFWEKILREIVFDLGNVPSYPLPTHHHIFRVIALYIYQYRNLKTNEDQGTASVHAQKNDYLNKYFLNKITQLSEGQKSRIVFQLVMQYIADKNTLILLDEPDAYLDVQKKRELFDMIESCKGQVILTTHDPITSNLMKDHLVFMENGHQISKSIPNAIKDLSEGEISYQEALYINSKCKHFVFVEGKTDIAFIKKAIRKLNYSKRFKYVTFLSLGSSGAVEDKYYTTIAEFLPQDTQKILFLFDADAAGYDGKKQIDELKALKNDNIDDLLKEKAQCKDEKHIQKLDERIYKIKETNFELLDKLTYCFYGKKENFSAQQDGDRMEWFYLEDYFKVETYPEEFKVTKKEIKEYFNDFIPKNDTENDDILKFRELESFGQKCKNQKFSNNASRIKNYFKDKLYLINDPSDFEPFRSLLDKILKKLELA